MKKIENKTKNKAEEASVEASADTEASKPKASNDAIPEFPKELDEFIEAGVQFGHKKSSVHPGMFPYIFGVRNSSHIIDVASTKKKLDEALEFLKSAAEEGKTILFVGTKLPVRGIVKEAAEETGMPYVVSRWFGGTITNWKTISERVQHLKDLRAMTKSEEWNKYPKHERMQMEKEIQRLEHNFGGLENMEKTPDVVFVVDARENAIALQEAKKINISTVGIADTNIDPRVLDYPIPANDDAISSVEFIVSKVQEVIAKNKKAKKPAPGSKAPNAKKATNSKPDKK